MTFAPVTNSAVTFLVAELAVGGVLHNSSFWGRRMLLWNATCWLNGRCNILTQNRATRNQRSNSESKQNQYKQEAAALPLKLLLNRCADGTSDFFTKKLRRKFPSTQTHVSPVWETLHTTTRLGLLRTLKLEHFHSLCVFFVLLIQKKSIYNIKHNKSH